ncbi:hypothetical protein SDC9_108264 [bioreactor metagenome]|uniref:Uncharacterized protein n=1 Tax=bioreactor metagenome TaxID=1076179 RepID=A0A645B8M4_9ZZZZ
MLPYNFYRGWYKDVINEFGKVNNLSDTMLNALARAYAQQASNLLSDQYALAVKSEMFPLEEGQNVLSQDQLNAFRQWHDKSLETYLLLEKKNPDFNTFIGDIHNVYSNEVMAAFLTLTYFSKDEEARKELEPGLYDDFVLKTARNYLLSCDSNAILFTNGDNDTYPLLYVQAFEKYRTDVTVINISLLGIKRYISSLFVESSERQPVKFTIPQSYWNNSSDGYYYVASKTDTMNTQDALQICMNDDLSNPDRGYAIYPARHSVLKWNDSDKISIYPREDYIFLNHLAMLDIISTNVSGRPVYFSITSNVPMIPTEFLLVEGLSYKVVPYQTNDPKNNFYSGGIEPDSLLEKFKNVFQLPDLSKMKSSNRLHQMFVNTYRTIMYQSMVEFANRKDTLHALEILDLSEQYFPYSMVQANSYTIPVAQMLYQIGESARADKLALQIIKGIEADYPVEGSLPSDLQYAYSMFSYMESLLKENSTDKELIQIITMMTLKYGKLSE